MSRFEGAENIGHNNFHLFQFFYEFLTIFLQKAEADSVFVHLKKYSSKQCDIRSVFSFGSFS